MDNLSIKVPDHVFDNGHVALAAIICFDQLPRYMFRNELRAYRYDDLAYYIAKETVLHGLDITLSQKMRGLIYYPFSHCEDIVAQDDAVKLFKKNKLAEPIKLASIHRKIIKQFDRFPQRNEILKRKSTIEEVEYLHANPAEARLHT